MTKAINNTLTSNLLLYIPKSLLHKLQLYRRMGMHNNFELPIIFKNWFVQQQIEPFVTCLSTVILMGLQTGFRFVSSLVDSIRASIRGCTTIQCQPSSQNLRTGKLATQPFQFNDRDMGETKMLLEVSIFLYI